MKLLLETPGETTLSQLNHLFKFVSVLCVSRSKVQENSYRSTRGLYVMCSMQFCNVIILQ